MKYFGFFLNFVQWRVWKRKELLPSAVLWLLFPLSLKQISKATQSVQNFGFLRSWTLVSICSTSTLCITTAWLERWLPKATTENKQNSCAINNFFFIFTYRKVHVRTTLNCELVSFLFLVGFKTHTRTRPSR